MSFYLTYNNLFCLIMPGGNGFVVGESKKNGEV